MTSVYIPSIEDTLITLNIGDKKLETDIFELQELIDQPDRDWETEVMALNSWKGN